jgi:hypothetical protein
MDPNDDGSITGKSGGISDEQYRSTATSATIWMPFIVFLIGLIMIFDI